MKKVLVHLYILALFSPLITGCGYAHYLNTGKEDFNNLKYADAKDKFNTALQKKPESYESLKMLALTLQKMKDYDGAEKAYELALNYPQVTFEDKFNYGTMLMASDKHADAELVFREYLAARPGDPVAKSLLESCQFIELFKDDSSRYKIEPLPLLSNVSMYSPVIYGEGLAYTAERTVKANKENPWTGNSFNNLYYMDASGGEWIDQTPIAEIFNSKYNDGPIAFNEAQDYAIVTRSYSSKAGAKRKKNDQNVNNLFLYSSELVNGEWTALQELSMNSEDFSTMHPALTGDGDTLYFSSDCEGGQGQYDLYMCVLESSGKWSKAKNLGPEINTSADEVFPVVRKDGALNFSSNGHPSLGGLDIFKSEAEAGIWKKPRNMNYPVNSTNDDFGLIYKQEDSLGYFSSNRNGVDRVYELLVRASGKVTIDGIVLGPDSLPMEGATVKLIDLETGDVVEEIITGIDGRFDFELIADKNYRIESSKDGYFTESYERSTMSQFEDETEKVVFNMRKLLVTDPEQPFDPTGAGVYSVDNIYYSFDRFNIRADAAIELDALAKLMKDNPNMVIELHSHTDAQGEDGYNQSLSDKRAKSARSYLINKGVSRSRIATKGFGETRILNECVNGVSCTDTKHEENRRTEFIVTSND